MKKQLLSISILIISINSINCGLFGGTDTFLDELNPQLYNTLKKGIQISLHNTHDSKEVIENGLGKYLPHNYPVANKFKETSDNFGYYKLSNNQKVIRVQWKIPNLQNFIEYDKNGGLVGGPHQFVYMFNAVTTEHCDFTFFETNNKQRMHNYEYIKQNTKFYPSRKIDQDYRKFVRDDIEKEHIVDATNPVQGSVYLITDCGSNFGLNFKIVEVAFLDQMQNLVDHNRKDKNRNLQLDDGDDIDESSFKVKTLFSSTIIIEPSYDLFSPGPKPKEPTEDLPPGRKRPGGLDLAKNQIIKVNVSDKLLQTSKIPERDASSGSSPSSVPETFKQWLTPTKQTFNDVMYGYHFFSTHYGQVNDYLDVSLEAMNMMFLIKRYARTNSDTTLLSIAEEKSHRHILNKIFFSSNDDYNDRVTFYCYKQKEKEVGSSNNFASNEQTNGKNNGKKILEEQQITTATLTYEFFPNVIYNIYFEPKCSKFIEIDNLRPVIVYIDGKELAPGEAPEDFDEEIVEKKHLVVASKNSLELKFRMEDKRKGKAYLKNFKFSVDSVDNGVPKSVHNGDQNGKYDHKHHQGADPQNKEGDYNLKAGFEANQFEQIKHNKFYSQE